MPGSGCRLWIPRSLQVQDSHGNLEATNWQVSDDHDCLLNINQQSPNMKPSMNRGDHRHGLIVWTMLRSLSGVCSSTSFYYSCLAFKLEVKVKAVFSYLQHATPLGDLGRILDAEALRMHLLACFSKHIFRWIQLRLSIG